METTLPLRQRLARRLFLAAVLLPALLHGYAIDYGSTREEVLHAYGSPPSKASSPRREIWTYREGQVVLENGVVVEFRFSKGEPPLINGEPAVTPEAPKPPPSKPAQKSVAKAVAKSDPPQKTTPTATEATPRPVTTKTPAPEPAKKPETTTAKASPTPTPATSPAPATSKEAGPPLPPSDGEPEEQPPYTPKGGEPGSGLGWWVFGILGLGALVLILLPRRDKTSAPAVRPATPRPATPSPSIPSANPTQLVFLTREVINRVEWRSFEELVRRYFETQGWVPQRVKVAKDGSTDVLLFREGAEKPEAAVLCKPWGTRNVTAQDLYSFAAMIKEEGYPKGFVVITNDFSADARVYAETARIELISGDELLQRFKYLPDLTHTAIIKQVLHGDFETPTCPNCETKMVRSQENSLFWNCPDYPHCSYSFPVRRDLANTKEPA